MKLCDEKCNECPIVCHENNRMLTKIFNDAYEKFGNEFYHIVQKNCPNLTVCYDCRIDDFGHFKDCKIVGKDEDGRR